MEKSKIIAAVIALVAVCVASFVGVRQLAKGERIDNPTIYVESTESTSAAPVVVSTEMTSGTTLPPATSGTTETTSAPTTSPSSLFSTYEVSTDVFEIPTSVINTTALNTTAPTTAAPATTIKPTQATSSTTKKTQNEKDKNIQEAAKQSKGFLDYKYNETGNYYYTDADPWQRMFGFNAAYDFGAQFVYMYFDTARIKFAYDNKDWMVEMWKGQYGAVFIGAEIGVYYKPKDRTIEHYDSVSDDDALYMEMTLYRNGDELLSREYTRYWWCTGFVPGKLKKYSDRSELNLKSRITLDNKRMLNAFVGGLESCKEYDFVKGKSYRVDGLDVFINW